MCNGVFFTVLKTSEYFLQNCSLIVAGSVEGFSGSHATCNPLYHSAKRLTWQPQDFIVKQAVMLQYLVLN